MGFLAALARMAARVGPAARAAAGKRGTKGIWNTLRKMAGNAAGNASGNPLTIPHNQPQAVVPTPKINYSSLLKQMGNPNALADARAQAAKQQAEQQAAQPQQRGWDNLGAQMRDSLDSAKEFGKGLVGVLGSVTGFKDGVDGVKALFAGDLSTAVKSLGKAAIKSSVSMFTIPFALKKWTESLVDSREHLRYFNARIGAAYSRLDIQKFRLNLRQANATSGTTTVLADQLSQLRENTQSIRELGANVINVFGITAARYANMFLQPLNKIAGFLEEKMENIAGVPGPKGINQKFIDNLAAGQGLLPKDRLPNPPRLGPNWRP